jgi:hypothetical protein
VTPESRIFLTSNKSTDKKPPRCRIQMAEVIMVVQVAASLLRSRFKIACERAAANGTTVSPMAKSQTEIPAATITTGIAICSRLMPSPWNASTSPVRLIRPKPSKTAVRQVGGRSNTIPRGTCRSRYAAPNAPPLITTSWNRSIALARMCTPTKAARVKKKGLRKLRAKNRSTVGERRRLRERSAAA